MVSRELLQALFDNLPNEAAVLDASGRIVAINDAWRRFALDHGGDERDHYIDWNYLDVCRTAWRNTHSDVIEEIASGLDEMLHGQRDTLVVQYALDSTPDSSWFNLLASRFEEGAETYVLVQHEDITQRRKGELNLQKTESMLRGVLDALPVGVWIMNTEGVIVLANPAGLDIWGGAHYVGPDEFGVYKGWWLDTGRVIEAHEWAGARAIEKGETTINEELMIETFDGATRKVILNSAIPLNDDSGEVSGAIIVNQDITSRKLMEDMLRNASKAVEAANRELREVLAREQGKARTDELTQLPNRRHFFDLARELFRVAERYDEPLSIILFDIDHFKRFNDLFGHDVGDTVLRQVAELARQQMREADVIARYGGEEFAVVLPKTDLHGATALAENIRRQISGWRGETEGKRLQVSVSLGTASRLQGDERIEDIIKHADQALYAAKAAGRNCTRAYETTLRRPPAGPGPSKRAH